jgi:acyl-CoA thioesterase-1
VIDEGISGETVAEGLTRLPGVLRADRPDALLLLEGVNDLNSSGSDAVPRVATGLQRMVQTARGTGLVVFLATLLPQRPGGLKAGSVALIEPLNEQIRHLSTMDGVVLVDLYQEFNGQVDTLISSDGLHPNAAGYQRLAASFFDAIRLRFEVVQPSPALVNVLGHRIPARGIPSTSTVRGPH